MNRFAYHFYFFSVIILYMIEHCCYCCVFSLVNLEVLELRDNLIRLLPSSLGCLTRLQSLDLGSNLIDNVVCACVLNMSQIYFA